MKIVVLNGQKVNFDGTVDYGVLGAPGDEVEVHDTCTAADYAAFSAGAEVIISKELPMSYADILGLPASVKLICEAGTGYNNIDLKACRERGIGVCNVPAYSSERVAHTAMMLLLNLSSEMQKQIAMLAKGDRRNFTDHLLVRHTEVNGKTLGVVGAGHVGMKVVQIGLALDMKVLVASRSPKPMPEGAKQVSLEELLKEADYISLNCPLTPETKHLINKETIAKMKDGAAIINTGRGALIDEEALIEALRSGKISGAGLDVQETEPPAEDSPLYSLPNVILTPHMGWKGLETRARLVSILKDGIDGYRRGERVNRVD